MHNELVSYVQSNHAADGVEVRAVGPKAVTLALPPELHDLGHLCGELEVRFNARIDIAAPQTPGIGPTATVWVMQDAVAEDNDDAASRNDDDDEPAANPEAPAAAKWPRRCPISTTTIAASLTVLAAIATIASHSTTLWKHLEL